MAPNFNDKDLVLSLDFFYSLKKGDVILELRCVNKRLAISCLSSASVILPFKTFIFKA